MGVHEHFRSEQVIAIIRYDSRSAVSAIACRTAATIWVGFHVGPIEIAASR